MLAVTLIVASCTPSPAVPPGVEPSSQNVGVAVDLPGVSSLDGAAGIWSGFDIDLARWLGNRANFSPVFVATVVGERIARLKRGDVQLVIEAFSITDENQQQIDYAGP
ncbi:hypothetical protein D7Y13_43400, partial [Corallococcus praedator]